MDWRTIRLPSALFIIIGQAILIAEFITIPLEMREGTAPFVYVLTVEFALLAVLGIIGGILYQYIRLVELRPAFDLAGICILVLIGLMWYLGPTGVPGSGEPLTASEKRVIRTGALVFGLFVLLFVRDIFTSLNDGNDTS